MDEDALLNSNQFIIKVEPLAPQLNAEQPRIKSALSQPPSPPRPTAFTTSEVIAPIVNPRITSAVPKARRGRGAKVASTPYVSHPVSTSDTLTNGHHIQTTLSSPTHVVPPPYVESISRKSSMRLREKPAKNYFEPQVRFLFSSGSREN
jgi:hypothetical protein